MTDIDALMQRFPGWELHLYRRGQGMPVIIDLIAADGAYTPLRAWSVSQALAQAEVFLETGKLPADLESVAEQEQVSEQQSEEDLFA